MQVSKKALMFGAAGITAVVAAATAGTLAIFADPTNTGGAQTFSTGSIALSTDMTDSSLTYTSAGGMMPGHVVTAAVVVTNEAPAGANNRLRYAITVSMDLASYALLTDALVLTVKQADGNPATGGVCSAFSGNTLYTGDLDGATAGRVVGSPGRGAYDDGSGTSYNDDRELAGDASETLCFRVALPLEEDDNDLQGKSAIATFNFSAEQVVNNTQTESPTP